MSASNDSELSESPGVSSNSPLSLLDRITGNDVVVVDVVLKRIFRVTFLAAVMLKSHGSAILGGCGAAPLGDDDDVDSLTKESPET